MNDKPNDRCPLCGGRYDWQCRNMDCSLYSADGNVPEDVLAHQLALIEDAHRTELAAVKVGEKKRECINWRKCKYYKPKAATK